ncbi:MAG TPA: FAD-binding oxidoreductase [Candidatus Limnocylindrales bacterium]|nr:FAD-binding oxidoreductase [Candidatus Limnocylindrales bacterium]
MRRWNGWAEEGTGAELPPEARRLLALEVGSAEPDLPVDAHLADVIAALPSPRLAEHRLLSTDGEDRVRHARGQSLPDWIALRSGRLGAVPDAVARPASDADVEALLRLAAERGARVIPYGGGTSVVGGITPPADDDRPTLTLALDRLAGLTGLDERSGLAAFGAGTVGPHLEAALEPHGLTLGHFPQSFERSTLGGWIAARSAGQQSIGFGRIEDLFAGGRVVAPAGTLELPSHPASAAGPDLRQLVLGSEGRFGVITSGTVRAVRKPPREAFPTWFMRDWRSAVEGAGDVARAGLPLSMLRVSTPLETQTLLALSGRSPSADLLARYLRLRGVGAERCLVIVGASGLERFVEGAVREAGTILKRHGGIAVGGSIGRRWIATRFRSADLRDALWDAGYAVDTLETAVDWTRVPDLAAAIGRALRHGLDDRGERVHAFSHLSHVYPDGSSIYATYVFRRATDPDETLDRWRRLKMAASEAIVAGGGTISHQHGVGRDHLPYLAAEKGDLGMAVLGDIVRRFDPDGIMNPGVLIEAAQ